MFGLVLMSCGRDPLFRGDIARGCANLAQRSVCDSNGAEAAPLLGAQCKHQTELVRKAPVESQGAGGTPKTSRSPANRPKTSGFPNPLETGLGAAGSSPSPRAGEWLVYRCQLHTALSCRIEDVKSDISMQIYLIMTRQRDPNQNNSLHSTGTITTAIVHCGAIDEM